MKKVAILQSNYIPWKGYFDLIRQVDCFIFYDDVQYTKNDWRNRNKIKTPQGIRWITIPCGSNLKRLIKDVRIDNIQWQKEHYKLLENTYLKSSFWHFYKPFIEEIYLRKKWKYLSELNQTIIMRISNEIFKVGAIFETSESYKLDSCKEARVLQLLDKAGATHYLSGPAAKSYLHEENFNERNITLEYIDYSGYPEYTQPYPPFEHAVTVLDLLFNEGPSATHFMQHVKNR